MYKTLINHYTVEVKKCNTINREYNANLFNEKNKEKTTTFGKNTLVSPPHPLHSLIVATAKIRVASPCTLLAQLLPNFKN